MGKEVDRDYEELVENYEDAMMRLIMYRVAQEDGKRLLQEAEELEKSGFKVPKRLDEKCLKLIREGCASQTRNPAPSEEGAGEGDSRRRGIRLYTVARAALIAILAAVVLFCTAYALNEDFRVGVLNFFLELRENGTWFSFQNNGEGGYQPQTSNTKEEFPFEFTYIPDGYELFAQEAQDLGNSEMYYYCAYFSAEDPPHEFYFNVCPISEGTNLFVDTEDAVVTEMTICGHDGWLIEKTEVTSQREKVKYYWFDLEKKYSFCYSSLGISLEKSKKILDGIVIPEQF